MALSTLDKKAIALLVAVTFSHSLATGLAINTDVQGWLHNHGPNWLATVISPLGVSIVSAAFVVGIAWWYQRRNQADR